MGCMYIQSPRRDSYPRRTKRLDSTAQQVGARDNVADNAVEVHEGLDDPALVGAASSAVGGGVHASQCPPSDVCVQNVQNWSRLTSPTCLPKTLYEIPKNFVH